MQGRDFVVPEDIKHVAEAVLAHRCLTEETSDADRRGRVQQILGSVPVPTEDWGRR